MDEKVAEKRGVAFSALIFGLGTFASRVLGFFRDAIINANFSREITDAWMVAFKLPNTFRRLLGEGALSVSFIPVFIENLRKDRQSLKDLVSGVFTLLVIINATVCTLAIVFMEPLIIQWVGQDGFTSVPGKLERTVAMARVSFSFLFLMSLFAYFMAILNGIKQFGLSALAPCLLNISLIVAALFRPTWVEDHGVWLAWAALIGGFLQMIILVPPVVRAGLFPRLTRSIFGPETRKVLRAVGPSLIGLGILQITGMINVHFASRLEEGALTYINAADRVFELPLSLIAVSLQIALLPTLSAFWAEGNRTAMAQTANHYLRLNYFLAVPAAIGMFTLADPIMDVLFRWNKFTAREAGISAEIVQVYAFTLISAGGVRIMTQSFYAMKNTWLPALISAVSLIAHIFLVIFLIDQYGLMGLITATLASSFINLLILFVCFRVFVGPWQVRLLAGRMALFLVAGLVLAGVAQVFHPIYQFLGEGKFTQALALMTTIGLCTLAYFGSAALLRIPEFVETRDSFMRKLRRRRAN